MTAKPTRLLLVVEGANDISFLMTLASKLADVSYVAAVAQAIQDGRVMSVPLGGGDPSQWPHRFAGLGLAEFHLYDRESDAETALRLAAIDTLRQRPFCRGYVTARRSLENYLHPAAIAAAGGGQLQFGEEDSVAMLLARQWYQRRLHDATWNDLPQRRRKRRITKAKRWLNTRAVQFMTAELQSEADPQGEVLGWFAGLAELLPS